MITIPDGVVPVRSLTTGDVLYGDRVTEYRWEVLTHVDGADHLAGFLDGVIGESASLSWSVHAAVKGSGNVKVADLEIAQAGMLRIGDLPLESIRLRPVCVIDGLPEIPLSVFLVAAAVEEWSATGRVWALELLDRATVPDQDRVEETYAVAAGTNVLSAVKTVLQSAGEDITVDASVAVALGAGLVWETGTSKLQIVNDLLDAGGFNSLWVDGTGMFQATPYQLPAARSILYELLDGMPRELVDGDQSIYQPDWTRDRDQFSVPNKVVAVQSGSGDAVAMVADWTNEDPASPFSYPSRGRWIVTVLDGVDTPDGPEEVQMAFLVSKARAALVAFSAVKAKVMVSCLPIPVRVGDVVRFAHTPAGVDARHVVTSFGLDVHPLGLARLALEEVVDL